MIRKLLDLIEKTGMKLSEMARHDAAVLALSEQAAMKNKDAILLIVTEKMAAVLSEQQIRWRLRNDAEPSAPVRQKKERKFLTGGILT